MSQMNYFLGVVAQYGTNVVNIQAEMAQTIRDYQRTQFGGRPWPGNKLVYGCEAMRFTLHPRGHEEPRHSEPGNL